MIIVLADDITGAAEIAGIAHRYGLRAMLSLHGIIPHCDADVLVVASDTRSYTAEEAEQTTAGLTRRICAAFPGIAATHILFHKTDSALRGHVAEELRAMTENSPYASALYMPANPSKRRTIRDGIYRIDGVPITATPFSSDPEFPALTDSVSERFPGITTADAVTTEDVWDIVSRHLSDATRRSTVLLAGAADLFTALVEQTFSLPHATPAPFAGLPREASMIVVRGSTLSRCADLGIPVSDMPYGVFNATSPLHEWTTPLADTYRRQMQRRGRRGMVIAIGEKELRKGREVAVYLRETMAEACRTLLDTALPDELVIEGGATAFAILRRMPWHTLSVTDEIAPGVVRCKPLYSASDNKQHDIHITLKPGSYEWGNIWK